MSAATAPIDRVAEALKLTPSNPGIIERHFTDVHWERLPFPADRRPRAFVFGHCTILVGREPVPNNGGLRWHLSIAHPFRLPTWSEIKQARAELLPVDLHFCQPMPPAKYWINAHEYCLHLWEIKDPDLTAQWEAEVQL